MSTYDDIRVQYLPQDIRWLLIAESPPPEAGIASSRQFYRTDQVYIDDRLFVNTIKALYAEAADKTEAEIAPDKERWLRRLQHDGVYMIEALEDSQQHGVAKPERQQKIAEALPRLIERVGELVRGKCGIVLIKSNVYYIASAPLRAAGYNVLNTELVDYPGRFNQKDYRRKLRDLLVVDGWRE